MCGIVGYIGSRNALPTLLDALSRLEYRGYDSAGIAVMSSKGLEVRKRVGKLAALVEAMRQRPLSGHLGIGHCLRGDTLVQLADGRAVRIDTLQGDITVLALDPVTLSPVPRKARTWSHPAPEQLIELRIPFGQIACTPQHRVFTVDEAGNLAQKAAADLQPGELLLHASSVKAIGSPMVFRSVNAPRYYRLGERTRALIRTGASRVGRSRLAQLAGVHAASLDHLQETDRNASEAVLQPLALSLGLAFPLLDSEAVNSHHGNFVRLPTASSPELMQWIGYVLGDGHVGRRGIRCKDAAQDTLNVYRDLSERCFNVRGRIAPIPNVAASLLELNSIGLADWVRVNVLDRRRQFLEDVGALPAEQLAAFLRGLFDAEGGVARQAGQVALTMTDSDLVRRTQLWLLRLGIVASMRYEKAAPAQQRPSASLKLLITRRDALIAFRTHLGFSSARKRTWLDQILTSKRNGLYVSSRAIPMTQAWMSKRLRNAGIPLAALRPYRGGQRLTDGQAAKLLRLVRQFPDASTMAQLLERWLSADVRAQKILSVRRVPSQGARVYDLEVEGVENFFANGILSHNSRWATHGEPSERNAHPHVDCTGQLAVVHNGIIENYAPLKTMLRARGHTFRSETDTEVLAHLIEDYAKEWPLPEAVRRALRDVEGSFAIGVIAATEPRQIIAARCGSPLVLGLGDGEQFIASDVPALLGYTRKVIYLHDRDLAVLTGAHYRILTLDGRRAARTVTPVRWNLAAAQKEGFPHFMLKEIHEQPQAVADTLANRLIGAKDIQFDVRTRDFLSRHVTEQTKLVIISCGTAYHAGLVGEYMLEEYVRLPVAVDVASEFRYRAPLLDAHTLVLAITQSGETADTLAGLRMARAAGAKILAICNVMGSSIARESDAVLYTHAGPEIAVASTKAYTAQLAMLYLLTLYLARQRGTLTPAVWTARVRELAQLPRLIQAALRAEPAVKRCAARYARHRNFYFLGRRYNYPAALEGALKLKEVCPLVHAEGYAAGEMKHGPIALITKGWPVVCVAPRSAIEDKMRSNIEEIRARHGDIIAVATAGDRRLRHLATQMLPLPPCEELFSPLVAAIPLQLLAYHMARLNGCDIDQPPNLAKSVTVE